MKKCSKITDILSFKWRAVEEKMEMILAKIALRNTLNSKKIFKKISKRKIL